MCYCLLAAVTASFCVLAFGNVRSTGPIEQQFVEESPFEGSLIGQPNPALAGIEALYVFVDVPDNEPNERILLWKELDEKVEQKLKAVDIKVLPKSFSKGRVILYTSLGAPAVKIVTNTLKLDDSQRYVVHIQTSLARTMTLPNQHNLLLNADVWKVKPVMKLVSADNFSAAVTGAVMKQVDAFIYACLAANQKHVRPTDVTDMGTAIEKELIKPLPKPAISIYNYVASKNSKVFHRPECSSTAKISPNNLIGYDNRADAIESGKRPCKRCKP
jgi:hypothetical protein